MLIGILALQGAFIEHEKVLTRLKIPFFEIRNKSDLKKKMDGLIIPGGESTVIGKLLKDLDLMDSLREKILKGLPVFGTCAGMILLAKKINMQEETYLSTMNIEVKRNAYGRQLGSFYTQGEFADFDEVKMSFIRAPYIIKTGTGVKVLSKINGNIVAVKENNQLVTSFHPELSDEIRVHQYFIEMIENFKKNK